MPDNPSRSSSAAPADARPAASLFSRFARWVAAVAGSPRAFAVAALLICLWAVSGPAFAFSDTWQLVINTSTTIVTFLMVFVIQNTQNRDSAAMHLKLDELIKTSKPAHNALLDLEELSQEDLEKVRTHYEALARAARARTNGELVADGPPANPD